MAELRLRPGSGVARSTENAHIARSAPLFQIPLAVTLHRIQGKLMSAKEMKGKLTRYSHPWAVLEGPDPIDAIQEVRIDAPGEKSGPGFAVYAKVFRTTQRGHRHVHTVQITYQPAAATQYFTRYESSPSPSQLD